MKQSLGRFVLFIMGFVLLQAEDFSYRFHIDNTKPYVKEAVILTFDVKQTNHGIVLLFDFELKKSDAYSFQRIGIEENDAYHAAEIRYTYLVYPLRSGNINIDFKLIQKSTTDDSVAYSFSGDRDNIKGLVTKDTNITLPSQVLSVKTLPEGTQLVGDFSLAYRLKKHSVNTYETIPFTVILKGDGYPPIVDRLIPENVNFTYFAEQPDIKSVADTKGSHSTVIYAMALSHSDDFKLPSIALKAFNPKTQKAYVLKVPSQKFKVRTIKRDNLVDKVDSPAMLKTDYTWLKTLMSYLVVFGAGYLTAFTLQWQNKSKQKVLHPLVEKIRATKDTKTLLQLLMAQDSHHFSAVISTLEDSLYGDVKIKLEKAKQEAEDLL